MNAKKLIILDLTGPKPLWLKYEAGGRPLPFSASARRVAPDVALVPDKYFFYYAAGGTTAGNTRRRKAAVEMQMSHFFPPLEEKADSGVLIDDAQGAMGWISKPELGEFLEQHKSLLERARVVTTKFVSAWSAAGAEALPRWSFHDGNGVKAVSSQEGLHFLTKGDAEYKRRTAALPDAEKGIEDIDWSRILPLFGTKKVKPSRLHMAPHGFGSAGQSNTGKILSFVCLTLIAALVFSVEIKRLRALSEAEESLQRGLDSMYAQVLGNDIGNDPFGMLIYKYDRLRGSQIASVDLIRLLAVLGGPAPAGTLIEDVNVNITEGFVRGTVNDYNVLETWLTELNKDPEFRFILEQASAVGNRIAFSLKVDFGGRS